MITAGLIVSRQCPDLSASRKKMSSPSPVSLPAFNA
jgi:hypothetical protein